MATPFYMFLVREAAAVAAFNAGINASYTWFLWRSLDPLTLFGVNGIGADLASTPVWIGLLSTLLGTASIRRRLSDGRVVVGAARANEALGILPGNILARSIVVAAACGLLLGTPLWLLLSLAGNGELSLSEACTAKVLITIPLSLLIVLIVIFCALGDVQGTGKTASAR